MRREREREKERKVEGRGEGVAGERGCGVASVPAQWPGHRVLCLVLCALFSLILFDSRPPPPPPPPHHHHHHHHHDPPTTEIAPFYHLSWTLVRGPVRPRTILSLSPHIRCDSDQRHLLSLSLFLSLPLSPRRSFHYIPIFVTLDKPASSYRREYIVVQVVKSRERVENDRAKET